MYAQNLLDGTWRELAGNVSFSDTVYQTAESLTDEQRDMFDVFLIVDMPLPELTREQKYGDPLYVINGTSVERSYPVLQKSQEEIDADTEAKAAEVRAERNAKLFATDWTQGKDIPDSVSTPWAAYRQALRDVPDQPGFPWSVVWPTQPE